MMDKRKIGIIGGTFDPIHNGHLVLAQYVKAEIGLEKVIFIPAGIPPHKANKNITQNEKRYEMVASAIQSNTDFEVSDIEITSKEISYTLYTLRKLKEEMGENVSLHFIMGADSVFDVENWRESKALLTEFTFITGTRPGYLNKALNEQITYLNNKYHTKIETVEVPGLDISSSDIRQRVLCAKSIKYLVPEKVEQYILEHGLYQES